jgi:Xaa-Pro aminopeptidase
VIGRERLPVHQAGGLFAAVDREFGGEGDLAEAQGLRRGERVGLVSLDLRAGVAAFAPRHEDEEEGGKESGETARKEAVHRSLMWTKEGRGQGFSAMAAVPRSPAFPLLYDSSARCADVLYFGGVAVPDAFIAFGDRGRKVAVLSRLEISRVRREGAFDELLSLEALVREAKAAGGSGAPDELIVAQARAREIPAFTVGADFPAGLARRLEAAGLRLEIAEGMLFPAREIKDDAEAAAIREGNAASAAGFRAAEKALRAAKVGKGGKLFLGGRVLTSERLRFLIDTACLERGAIATDTIVAGGDQACDPHCRGSGPLRAHELIIIDIFPRVAATGFHGDMTRTYLKGRASEAQRALYATVFEAQQAALGQHRAGRGGKKIYDEVCALFRARGYETKVVDGTPVGFFHGLGHGLGLEVHEPPRVNQHGTRLRKGQVITVEPGLYYPGLGGVRIEDVVRVTAGEPELLSSHPYRWEFR